MGLGILVRTSLFEKLGLLITLMPLLVGLWYAARPVERRLALMRPLSLAAIFSSIGSLLLGLANALKAVGTASQGEMSLPQHAASMLAESLIPSFLGFAFLTVAWLCVAVGSRRSV